jgi:CRP/FNR family transcriptional regulator
MNTATLEAPVRPAQVMPLQRARTAGALTPLKTQCSSCHLRDLCLPCGMSGQEVDELDSLMFSRRKVAAGQDLYQEGERFSVHLRRAQRHLQDQPDLADGREQVVGFYMAGELMGLDGIASGKHASTAIALEDAEVCAIPYAHLARVAMGSAGLQQAVTRLMSREIVREHSLMMLLGSMNAEERLAAFLLNLSQRLKARGYSPTSSTCACRAPRSAATWA